MKYLFTILLMGLSAVSYAQNIIKYKDDFGLICPMKHPRIILYSPQNKIMYEGERAETPFYRSKEIIPESVKKTPDYIRFMTRDIMSSRFTIDRASLKVTVDTYNSSQAHLGIPSHNQYNYNCELMSDEDFIETMKYYRANYPEPVASPPAQKPKNKL